MSGPPLQTSKPTETECAPSIDDLPPTLTVREAEAFLPSGDRHIRRRIQSGQIPITRKGPMMLDTAVVLAIAARHANERTAGRPGPLPEQTPEDLSQLYGPGLEPVD